MKKVFVSTFPFSRSSEKPLEILKKSGFEYALNPLAKKLSGKELYEFASDADVIIAGTEDLSVLIEKSSKLKLISRIGIGLDSVPLQICQSKGIKICYTPDAVTDAVAELALGMMISLTRKITLADRAVRLGGWQRFEGKSLKEQTIGLVGFGRIGKQVATLLAPYKPTKILIHDVVDKTTEINLLQQAGVKVLQVSLDQLIEESDIISFHIPKTPKTNNLINKDKFERMKNGVILVNTARGGIVNEEDLMTFLDNGKVLGAGLDVFNNEPYVGSLCKYDQLILTQHMGSCSVEARNRMEVEAVEDVIRFLKGENLLSPVDIDKELELLRN